MYRNTSLRPPTLFVQESNSNPSDEVVISLPQEVTNPSPSVPYSKPTPRRYSLPPLTPNESPQENLNENGLQTISSTSTKTKKDILAFLPYWVVYLLRALGIITLCFVCLGLPDYLFGLKTLDEQENPLQFLFWTSSVNVGGMPLLNWAIFFSLSCVIHYLTLMVVSFLPNLIQRIVSRTLDPKMDITLEVYLNYFKAIRLFVTFTIWFGFSQLLWASFVIFPAWRWKENQSDWYYYVHNGLLSLFACSAVWTVEVLLIEVIAYRFHRRAYGARIEESEAADIVIKKLSSNKIVKHDSRSALVASPVHKIEKARDALWNATKEALTANNKAAVKTFDSDVLITLRSIPDTSAQAETLAETLFYKLNQGRPFLQVHDFFPYFESKSKAKAAFRLFDRNDDGDVSLDEIKAKLVEYSQEKTHLKKSMMEMKDVVGSLHWLMGSIFFFICIIIIAYIFKTNVYTYFTAAATFLIPLAFIFGNSVRELFESVVSIFVKNYYDVGDTIMVEKEVFMVKSISITTTVLERRDGKCVYTPNSLLNSKMIENIRRSGFMSEDIEIKLGLETSQEELDQLQSRMMDFLESDPKHYSPTFTVVIRDVLLAEKALKCVIILSYKFNWQEMARRAQKRNAFMYALTNNIKDIGIRCPPMFSLNTNQDLKP